MKQLRIDLDDERKKKLKILAAEKETTIKKLVISAIDNILKNEI